MEMDVQPAERTFAIAIAYSRTPLPMTRADQMTVAHLISFLWARGHRVDLYCLDTGESMTTEQSDWLGDRCRKLVIVRHGLVQSVFGALKGLLKGHPLQVGWFQNQRQTQSLAEGASEVDLCYSYYIRSAESMRKMHPGKATIVAMQLSQSLNTRRMIANYQNFREKALYSVENYLLQGYEANLWRDFSRTVLIGQQDVDEIRGICRARNLPEIDNVIFGPHGTDISKFRPRSEVVPDDFSLVFIGVLRTYTNVHAITWFAQNVWPLVKESEPRSTLTIVGRDPRAEVLELARYEGITVVGEVENPADYIAASTLCIDPVQAGAGMQNKMIEFMAMGKPIVATSVANEGIGAEPGVHLEVADSPDEMAAKILKLFHDPDRAVSIGTAAREFVVENWTWEAHFLRLESEMYSLIDEHAQG